MKMNFKPLGLAAAVAAVTAGSAGVANAQVVASNGLADLAIVPYYTVKDSWGTGVHIINSSDRTQVVKLRFRRGSDSLDALDLNVIMSPQDEWTGFLNDNEGTIRLTTDDTTCTAPLPSGGGFSMPPLYREGADEGYIEIISMGRVTEVAPGEEYLIVSAGTAAGTISNALAYNAEHVDGVPRNCAAVERNFLDGRIAPFVEGVFDYDLTAGPYINPSSGDTVIGSTDYEDGGNALKVSWFIRDADTGIEFGDDAAHIADFVTSGGESMITNQETGVFSGDLGGFDFPDLNGGSPHFNRNFLGLLGTPQDKYNDLRTAFGVTSIINDWSDNPDLNVGTDWVVTIPGQYVMLDLPEYLAALADEDIDCLAEPSGDDGCDQRDIPVRAAFGIYDREETLLSAPGDRGVVVSPSIPGAELATELRFETNVIHWGTRPVMDSDYSIDVDTSLLDQVFGWARLSVTSKTGFSGQTQGICYWTVDGFNPAPGAGDPNDLMDCTTLAAGTVPMVGFVAWERSFPENPDGNYGRAIRHSFEN